MTNPTTPLPDHPIRQHWAWQVFVRSPRVMVEWVTVLGLLWAFVIDPSHPGVDVSDALLFSMLAFAAALFGIRTFEAIKGVR
ncbi:hypothetical protein ABC955_15225 [Citromicrobium bathyomarinum]